MIIKNNDKKPPGPQTPTKVVSLLSSVSSSSFDNKEEVVVDDHYGKKKKQWQPPSSPRSSLSLKLKKKKTTVMDKLFFNWESFTTQKRRRASNTTRTTTMSVLYTLLNPRSHQWYAVSFKWFISNLILVDFVFFVLSTEPRYRDVEDYQAVFSLVERTASSISLVEYLARLYTITEHQKYAKSGPLWGRLQYACSVPAVIDGLATMPLVVEFLLYPGLDMPQLSYLRIFRLFRINGLAKALDALWRVLYYNRQILHMSLFVGLVMILTTSILLYYLRPRGGGDNHESTQFESMLSTMYLSISILTGQGGPEGELPWYTKGGVMLASSFSIGMFAIPIAMLTWGFEAEAERCARRARQLERKKQQRRRKNNKNGGGYGSDDDDSYSTDEEYKRIIAGEDSSDDEEENVAKELVRILLLAEQEFGSGTKTSTSLNELFDDLHHNNRNKQRNGKHNGSFRNNNGESSSLSSRLAKLEKKVDKIAESIDKLASELAPKKRVSWAS